MPRLTFESEGEGEPILFVHGLGGTSNVFGPQVAALVASRRCVRVSLPGSGDAPWEGKLSIEGFAAQIAHEVLDDLPGADLVGHSLGTIVCQQLAVLRPGKVRSLTLIGPIHTPPEAARAALAARAAKARSEGMTGIADAIVAGGTAGQTRAERPEIAAFVRELVMRQPPEGYAATCEALAKVQGADVSQLACPALLITGAEDATASPAAAAELAGRIANARLEILAACGHWAPIEQPAAVSAHLRRFLGLSA